MALSESYSTGQELPAADVVAIAKAINRSFFPGKIEDFIGLEAAVPTGWLLAAGGTIGNASSNGTSRANADMAALFAVLWDVGNTYGTLALFTSGGGGSSFGANAAADFAANRAIALPDLRGRIIAARDDMGGSDAGRMVANETAADKVAGTAGAEKVSMDHTHNANAQETADRAGGGGHVKTFHESNPQTSGGMNADPTREVVQPTMFANKIICAGVAW